MIFADRNQAGMLLGERLLEISLHEPILLALPRGGVPVAIEAGKILGAPVDVLIVRKLGVPWHEELGMGAVTENGFTWIERRVVDYAGVLEDSLNRVIEREKIEVERRVKLYRGARALPNLKNRSVVLIDDGIAMGVTARAACTFARSVGASQVVLAVPVCSAQSALSLREEVDELVCLHEPDLFQSVGEFYEDFRQLSDQEVLSLLAQERKRRSDEAA